MIASLPCFEMALRAIPSVTLKNSIACNTHVSLSEVGIFVQVNFKQKYANVKLG